MENGINNLYYYGNTVKVYIGNPIKVENLLTTYNNVDLIVCSSLDQIIIADTTSQTSVANFPIDATNVYYTIPPNTSLQPSPFIPQNFTSNILNYDYESNTQGQLTISRYNFAGLTTATSSASIPSLFYSLSSTYFRLTNTENPQTKPVAVFAPTSSTTINDVNIYPTESFDTLYTPQYVPGYYPYFSGSNITESVQNLATTINRVFSGSNASSSYDLLYATSSDGLLILSGSRAGSYANGFTIDTLIISSSGVAVARTTQSLYGGTDTRILSGSTNILTTTTPGHGEIIVPNDIDYYYIEVSGSGRYDKSSLTITDATTSATIFTTTSLSSVVSASIISSNNSSYLIKAVSQAQPYIRIEYRSSSLLPITGSASNVVSYWNNYFAINATYVDTTGSSVALIGDGLLPTTAFFLSESIVADLEVKGLINLTSCSVVASQTNSASLLKYPTIEDSASIQYLQLNYHTDLTSSIVDLTNYPLLRYLDLSHNRLSGSVPNLSPFSPIREFYCNDNALSGSIGDIGQSINLVKFDCKNNNLSGSFPSMNGFVTEYIDVSNNILTSYTSESISGTLTYINAYQNNLSQDAIEGIVKDVYGAGALNGYLNLSGSGNSTASLATLITASVLQADRGWEVYLNGSIYQFDADYLVISYQFDNINGGTDLDIRQRIVSPIGTKYHGYSCVDSSPAFNAALTVPPNIGQSSYVATIPYLYWSGDNTGTGVESTYINLSSFNATDIIQVECRAFWFGTRTLGDMTLDIKAYKGGSMSQSGFQFQNNGGTQVANITIPYNITSVGGGGSNPGQKIGDLYYNNATKTLIFI